MSFNDLRIGWEIAVCRVIRKMFIACFQITHWHSPRFHAYFPTANSYPAIVADILSGAIACIGFTWVRKTTQVFDVTKTLVLFKDISLTCKTNAELAFRLTKGEGVGFRSMRKASRENSPLCK